ncbi:MAG: hypothetical protein WCO19_02610 [Candidatus Saccharibacteria bacterium]
MLKQKSYKKNDHKSPRSRRPFIIGAFVLVVGIVAVSALLYSRSSDSVAPSPTAPVKTTNINYNPPSKEEIKETEDRKGLLSDPIALPVTNPGGKVVITPVVTNASQSELRSFIPGITEDGGKCLATFTYNSVSFTKESTGFKNVNTTICEPIVLSRSDFSISGKWSVFVTYTSNSSEGKSQVTTFEVQ